MKLPCLTRALLSLALAACLHGAVPQLPELNLGSDGSPLEAMLFAHAYRRGTPGETAVVCILDPDTDGRARDTVAVYSEAGQLKVRVSGAAEVIPLAGAPVTLLEDAAALRKAVLEVVGPYDSRRKPAPGPLPSTTDLLAKIKEALPDPDLPVAASKVSATKKLPDGRREAVQVDALVFDSGPEHFVWRPGSACSRVKIPEGKGLRFTRAFVPYADLLDAVLYGAAWSRLHPQEQGVLSFPGIDSGNASVGTAAFLSSDKTTLRVYNPFLGELAVEGSKPDDLKRPLFLSWIVWNTLSQHIRRTRPEAGGDDGKERLTVAEVYTTLGMAKPESLPGDTTELQLQRACALLKDAGVKASIDWDFKVLRFEFQNRALSYHPSRGGWAVLTNSEGHIYPPKRPEFPLLANDALQVLERAEAGNENYLGIVGTMLLRNEGCPRDDFWGQKFLRPLVEKGDAEAALELGRYLLDKEPCTAEEDAVAAKSLKLAAIDGFPEAIYNYGVLVANKRVPGLGPVEGLAWMLAGNHNWGNSEGIIKFRKDHDEEHPEWYPAAVERSKEIEALLVKLKNERPTPSPVPKT